MRICCQRKLAKLTESSSQWSAALGLLKQQNQGQTVSQTASPTARKLFTHLLLCLMMISQVGCVNTLVMVNRIFLGDPMLKSGFEEATGVNIKKTGKRLLVHCTAIPTVNETHSTLVGNLEEEILSRLRRKEMAIVPSQKSRKTFERLNGTFDPQALCRDINEVDLIFLIQVERFTYLEDTSPNFYRGNASGTIVGYEVSDVDGSRQAMKVYDQRFSATYPTTYPVSRDQTPQNVFIRRFVDNIADSIGRTFYDVYRSELFAG